MLFLPYVGKTELEKAWSENLFEHWTYCISMIK